MPATVKAASHLTGGQEYWTYPRFWCPSLLSRFYTEAQFDSDSDSARRIPDLDDSAKTGNDLCRLAKALLTSAEQQGVILMVLTDRVDSECSVEPVHDP